MRFLYKNNEPVRCKISHRLMPLLACCSMICLVILSCKTENTKNYMQDIVGTWKDENSTMTYAADSTWNGTWDTGLSMGGHWAVVGDTLYMFRNNSTALLAYYKVLKVSDEEFEIFSLEGDSTIFNKRRIE